MGVLENERKRTVKLLCPSLSKIVQVIASDEQRLDLGSISRAFGLDPATVKLNGHFISRGVDLIASSVTWKSLLSFFSARGLSTGVNGSDALIVDGKACKVGTKRTHDPIKPGNLILDTEHCHGRISKKPLLGCSSLLGNGVKESGSGAKRKSWVENVDYLKKTRRNEPLSGLKETKGVLSMTMPKSRWSCSFIGGSMKRMREDEIVVAAPLKKIR